MRAKILVLCLILGFTSHTAEAAFATTDVVVPAAGQIEGTGGQMFSTTLTVTNPNAGSIGYRIELLKAGVSDPNAPAINDTLAAGASRSYENIAQTVFGLTSTDRAAVRVQSPLSVLVATTLEAQVSTEPVLATSGFLYAAVPDTFGISTGETATLREVELRQDVRYHLLASETSGTATTIRVRVRDPFSTLIGESLIALEKFEQRLIPARSIVGFANVPKGSIEVTVEAGNGNVLVAGSLVTDQVQPQTGFDIAANSGSITGVLAGAGLTGGGTSGNVTLAVADGGITAPKLAPASVTGAKIANGSVVRNINGKTDNVTIDAGANITILNNANGLTISATATNANVPDTIVKRDANGGFAAGTITATLSGNATTATTATSFSGTLNGDVTGPQSNTSVKRVGGVLANAIANAVSFVNEATHVNEPKTLVARDGDGNFAAGTIEIEGILKDGQRLLHTTGTNSTFLGTRAGNPGFNAFDATGIGASALQNLQLGFSNTAIGSAAFGNFVSGSNNVAIGANAGTQLTSGGSNLYISNLGGNATENQTTRIGQAQTRTFIAGIRGVTTGLLNAIPVMIDSNGQLGTVSSSARFKFDVQDMNDVGSALHRLRPVTFRYNSHAADSAVQYGLIAEEVAKVLPELVVFDESGQAETVMYHFLTPMLLKEVQTQRQEIDDLRARFARMEKLLGQ